MQLCKVLSARKSHLFFHLILPWSNSAHFPASSPMTSFLAVNIPAIWVLQIPHNACQGYLYAGISWIWNALLPCFFKYLTNGISITYSLLENAESCALPQVLGQVVQFQWFGCRLNLRSMTLFSLFLPDDPSNPSKPKRTVSSSRTTFPPLW